MDMQTKNLNPFGDKKTFSTQVGIIEQQRASSEIQAIAILAKSSPRNQIVSMDRILNACTRPSLANSGLYSYSRGGQEVSGASIRLAETIAQCWGNIQFGIREIEQENGRSLVNVFAWDVETTTRSERTFFVPHIRSTKKGNIKLEDPRDIYEHVANHAARRLRECIFAIIPGDVVEAAVNQCHLTLKANVDTSPAAIQILIQSFDVFGVKKEHIEKRLQRRLEGILPAQIISLRKIYTSLRDGMSSPAEWFDITDEQKEIKKTGVEGLKEKIAKKETFEKTNQQESTEEHKNNDDFLEEFNAADDNKKD